MGFFQIQFKLFAISNINGSANEPNNFIVAVKLRAATIEQPVIFALRIFQPVFQAKNLPVLHRLLITIYALCLIIWMNELRPICRPFFVQRTPGKRQPSRIKKITAPGFICQP